MKTYIDWVVKQGFAVIDVNLPKHVVDVDDSQEHEEQDTVDNRTKEATQLLTYLWDNYIELSDSTHVFLMGTNTGHGAILNFIKANEERAQDRLTTAISFVQDVSLQSCKSATNDGLASWYYSKSLVHVTSEHNFWYSDLSMKRRKRFGNFSKSSGESISDMLIEHRDTVFNHLLNETAAWRASKPEDSEMADTDSSPARLPPLGNFALSPRPKETTVRSPPASNVASPRGRQSRTPRAGSPVKGPPLGTFAASPGV